jgi:hypothetical protein
MMAASPRVMVRVEPIDIDRCDDATDKQQAAMVTQTMTTHAA